MPQETGVTVLVYFVYLSCEDGTGPASLVVIHRVITSTSVSTCTEVFGIMLAEMNGQFLGVFFRKPSLMALSDLEEIHLLSEFCLLPS